MAKLGLERLDGDEAERVEIGWLFWSMSFVWEQRLRDLRTIVTDEIHQIKLLSRNASCCRRQSTSWHFPEHNTNTTIEFVFQRLPKWLLSSYLSSSCYDFEDLPSIDAQYDGRMLWFLHRRCNSSPGSLSSRISFSSPSAKRPGASTSPHLRDTLVEP
jgi:hypothetical protein